VTKPSPASDGDRAGRDALPADVRRYDDLDRHEREQMMALLRSVYPDIDDADFRQRHAQTTVFIRRSGHIASTLWIIEREVAAGDVRVQVGGIGRVATLPSDRGRGLATTIMRAAAEHLAGSTTARFGLLRCDDDMITFYRRLGWETIDGELSYERTIHTPHVANAMALSLHGDVWPGGPVDLRGTAW
jgi:predicted GNAT family N-acyltransferase